MSMTITPTEHEKAELSRCAQSMYSRDMNEQGHMLSAMASMPRGAKTTTERYNEAMSVYRAWLAFDEPKPQAT